MTGNPDDGRVRPGDHAAEGDAAAADPQIRLATEALRQYSRDRWVEVSDRVLTAALTAPRRSRPVRAHAPGGDLHVSEQVLIAYLRAAVDGAVPGTAVNRISIALSGRDTFESVVIQILVRYRLPVLPAADRIREIATRVLDDLLGHGAADVRVTHVHVGDVTTGDPATTDPDE
jgi:hypothetical protein